MLTLLKKMYQHINEKTSAMRNTNRPKVMPLPTMSEAVEFREN